MGRSILKYLLSAIYVAGVATLATLLLVAGAFGQTGCELNGRVVDGVTGAPLAGVTVRVPERVEVSDNEGLFCFKQMEEERVVRLILSVVNKYGNHVECLVEDLPTQFVPASASMGDKVAIIAAQPTAVSPVELRLATVSTGEVEAFCTGCHTWNPCFSEATPEEMEKIFDASIPGVFVRKDQYSQFVEDLKDSGLTESTYTSIRYTCVHARSVDMVQAVRDSNHINQKVLKMPSNLPLREERYTTCDTCHTRHDTGGKPFLHLPYDSPTSPLCVECHI